jgi:hypothetical protein
MSMSGTVVEQSTRKPLAEGLNPDVSTGREKNGEKCKKKVFLVFGSGRKKKKELLFVFPFQLSGQTNGRSYKEFYTYNYMTRFVKTLILHL